VLLEIVRLQGESWWTGDTDHVARLAPSRAGDPRFAETLVRLGRSAVSPGAVTHYYRQSVCTDVRELLPVIQAPTLVLQRAHDQIAPAELGQYLAAHIAGAKYVELDGADHLWFTESADELVDEVEEFLTGARTSHDPDRKLATVLFTDIVGSTARAVELGDTRWRALLDEHDTIVRQELMRFGGREIDTTGDGFLATFDGPGRAIRGASAIRDALALIGVDVRAGVHTGEVEVRRTDRWAGRAHRRPSRRQRRRRRHRGLEHREGLAGGPDRRCRPGEHELKGVPGTWHLFAAEPDGLGAALSCVGTR
jgi:class 3 adenylate cyclase